MKPRAILLGVVAIALLISCNRQKEVRNKECTEFADWSNKLGKPIGEAVPDSEKAAATTNEKQSAMYRKLAEGARKSAKTPIPFQDPYVKGLGERELRVYDEVAVTLDHQADAWAKGDKEASAKAMREEIDAKARFKPITDEWMTKCRL